jgi:hypothetical protein
MSSWQPDESWLDFKQRALSKNILQVAERAGARLKRVGAAEWQGDCLGCGGRLTVDAAKRVFICQPSQATGDVIALAKHLRKLDFGPDAIEWINGDDGRDR